MLLYCFYETLIILLSRKSQIQILFSLHERISQFENLIKQKSHSSDWMFNQLIDYC